MDVNVKDLTPEIRELADQMRKEGLSKWTSVFLKMVDELENKELDTYISYLYLRDARNRITDPKTRREIITCCVPHQIIYSECWLGIRKKIKEE